MRTEGCPREAEVVEAARSGRWPDELLEHTQSCMACAEVRLVAGFLVREALATDPEPLPDPRLIWWRARFESRREVARRATRAITVVQAIAATCAAAVGIWVLMWLWPAWRQALGAVGKLVTPDVLPAGSADPTLVVLVSAVVIGAMVLRELAIARAR
jgi:hypothetical protein